MEGEGWGREEEEGGEEQGGEGARASATLHTSKRPLYNRRIRLWEQGGTGGGGLVWVHPRTSCPSMYNISSPILRPPSPSPPAPPSPSPPPPANPPPTSQSFNVASPRVSAFLPPSQPPPPPRGLTSRPSQSSPSRTLAGKEEEEEEEEEEQEVEEEKETEAEENGLI